MVKTEKNAKKRGPSPTDVALIDLTGDDGDETPSSGSKENHANNKTRASVRKRLKSDDGEDTSTTMEVDDGEKEAEAYEDDEIQVVEAAAPTLVAPAAASAPVRSTTNNNTDAEEDIQVVGMVNEQRLPHMRQHCTQHPFAPNTAGSKIQDREQANIIHCDQCYCYVCDCPVGDCQTWKRHCHATDTGTTADHWRNQRALSQERRRQAQEPPQQRQQEDDEDVDLFALVEQLRQQMEQRRQHQQQQQQQQQQDQAFTTPCQHCQAPFNTRSWRHLGGRQGGARPVDWCPRCGRVARACDLGKGNMDETAVVEFDPATMINLGHKTIAFSLVSRDPRLTNTPHNTAAEWARHEGEPGWIYSQEDMLEEMFGHRIGPRPALGQIYDTLNRHAEENLFDEETGRPTQHGQSVWDAECVLIPNWADRIVLQTLYRVKVSTGSRGVLSNLTAVWDKEQMKGTLELDVYIRCNHTVTSEITGLAPLLSAWFGALPLQLTDISGLLPAQKPTAHRRYIANNQGGDDETLEDVEVTHLQAALAARMQTHSIQRNKSLSRPGMGGQSTSINAGNISSTSSLPATTTRYYEEMLPVYGIAGKRGGRHMPSLQHVDTTGLISGHKNLGDYTIASSLDCLGAFLPYRHEVTCQSLLNSSSEHLFEGFTTPMNLVLQLENLGHSEAPYIEGLNVELLPFQKQTLQWAAEREMVSGGVNSFTWTKLPPLATAATANNDNAQTTPANLYFNPALQKLSKEQPPLVRGGIIAEEQGLGKTVISLALILRNPAPAQPESGSKSSCLATLPAAGPSADGEEVAFWDPNLAARVQTSNARRGRILSRGTLVVCTVSLVGQWIEEAKSKLKDPGLVYSYHGGNRNRDANVLARNSIVVTTYETLASDANFHRRKSKNPDKYCPPCEQVRWWRIICDESHTLRNASTKVNAVMDLVGDCKWLVTGTPVNTSLNDLKNQLRFLGLDDVATFCRSVNVPSNRRRRRFSGFEEMVRYRKMLYLLRPILMRHSQEQRYSGTTTTLMSLPPKSERVVEVTLSAGDAAKYKTMEKAARAAYASFKARTKKIGSGFLKLSQLLLPLRVACAGGKAPLAADCGYASSNDDEEEELEDAAGDGYDEEEDSGHLSKKKHAVRYSEYAFTSKMMALIEELQRVRDEDNTSKSLVFSQFPSTLKWLQGELPKHGFQFRTLSGDMPMRKRAKALHDFQNDPPTTIFLLSMRAGAVGINLTQANRVFLLEPHFNPALEAQAIGRVHRLGQTRCVEIIRMVVKDSVESRMMQMLEAKYGKTTGGSATDDDSDDDDDENMQDDDEEIVQKHGTKSRGSEMVGSLKSEKVDVVEEEFDLLFGLDSSGEEEVTKTDGDNEVDYI